MFVTSTEYLKALKAILAENIEVALAVAFWGRGAEKIVFSGQGKTVRVICNLQSGATNPATIEALMENGVDVRQNDQLHAKVVLGSEKALIGSANLSCNGLNFEEQEIEGWIEAGMVTQDQAQVKLAKDWFENLWKSSRKVSKEDLEEAKKKWEKRRYTRVLPPSSSNGQRFSLEKLRPFDLQDRDVFLLIYRDYHSREAAKAYRKEEEKRLEIAPLVTYPPIYEDWENLLKLPKKAKLIDLYYGPQGGLNCWGIYSISYSFSFKRTNGESGHIVVCVKEEELMGKTFSGREQKQLRDFLKPYIAEIWSSEKAEGEDAKIVSLSEVLKICGIH